MSRSTFEQLTKLVERLRAEDGCPWDRAQNHRSLRPYLIEGAHEAIAAIDANDPAALAVSWEKGIDPELALRKSIAVLSQACLR